jgi:hypothetical protein
MEFLNLFFPVLISIFAIVLQLWEDEVMDSTPPLAVKLAAVATPLLGMDFLTHFGLSIIPHKQQVLHAASGCTLALLLS